MADKTQGAITLLRSVRENWLWDDKPFAKGQAWIDLLLKANYKDGKWLEGNQIIDIKRGELITSQEKLCHQWKWGTEKLRTFLTLLQTEQMITIQTTNKWTKLTILNYNDLQKLTNNKTNNKPTIKQIANRPLPETNKKDKNDNKEKNKDIPISKERTKTKKKELTEPQKLVEDYKEKYKEKFGKDYLYLPYVFMNASMILKQLSFEEARRRLDNAFKYEYWCKNPRNFGQFFKNINEFVELPNPPKSTEEEYYGKKKRVIKEPESEKTFIPAPVITEPEHISKCFSPEIQAKIDAEKKKMGITTKK